MAQLVDRSRCSPSCRPEQKRSCQLTARTRRRRVTPSLSECTLLLRKSDRAVNWQRTFWRGASAPRLAHARRRRASAGFAAHFCYAKVSAFGELNRAGGRQEGEQRRRGAWCLEQRLLAQRRCAAKQEQALALKLSRSGRVCGQLTRRFAEQAL